MLAINCRCRRLGSCAMASRCRLGSYAMTSRAYHRWGDALAMQRASTLELNREASVIPILSKSDSLGIPKSAAK
jgi:hypothetical protein